MADFKLSENWTPEKDKQEAEEERDINILKAQEQQEEEKDIDILIYGLLIDSGIL